MRDLYDTIYGIHNHNKQGQHPFATVMTHESEENTITSNLYASIDIFRERKIKETFGISYLEYLSLPTDMCLALLDGGMKAIQNESNTTNAVLKDLANAAKK